MFRSFRVLLILAVLTAILSMTLRKRDHGESIRLKSRITSYYETEMGRFDSVLREYPNYFYDSLHAVRLARYQDMIRQLTRIEALFTYFNRHDAESQLFLSVRFEKREKGPPLPDNWLFIGPFGMEADSIMRRKKKEDTLITRHYIGRAVTNFRELIRKADFRHDLATASAADIADALRLEMMRISTTTLGNAIMGIEEGGMPALEGSFDGWCEMAEMFIGELGADDKALAKAMRDRLKKGQALLDARPSFNEFNRMQFLTEILIPVSKYWTAICKSLGLKLPIANTALNPDASHAYEAGAINTSFFTGSRGAVSPQKVALGRLLFFDPILSSNNKRSCASCHKPELAFTDGKLKSVSFDEGQLARNAPTIMNSALQQFQFWDMRTGSLEDQLDSVINNADELHSSFEELIDKINSSSEYRKLFASAFPATVKKGIQREDVKNAIASYERSLVSLNSRFDQYVRGDSKVMNASEVNGFNLFMGKARCATCHYAPLFNAVIAPYFDSTHHRAVGVPLRDTMSPYQVDPDTGVSRITKDPFTHFSFKIPTVRNAELTAPYMHNGAFRDLAQVVDFYNDGAGAKFTKEMRPGMKSLPFFTIIPFKLNLSVKEKGDLVAFMKSLTDSSAIRKSVKEIPARLPRLAGKYSGLNKRKIGGEY